MTEKLMAEWREVRTCRQMFLQRRRFAWTDGIATSLSWYSNSSGWYPRDAMNGETFVTVNTLELCAYSTHVRKELNAVRLCAMTHLSALSRLFYHPLGLTIRLGVVAGG